MRDDTQQHAAAARRAAARALAALHNSRWTIRVITGVILAVTLLALPYATLTRATPRWWSEAPAAAPASGARAPGAHDIAQRLENTLTTELHRGRPAHTEWTLTLTEADANAWIQSRLARWLAHRDAALARDLPEIRVRFEHGRIRLGARQYDRVIGCALHLNVDDRGSIRAHLRDATVGRAPLPGALARALARDAIPERLRDDPDAARVLDAVLSGAASEPNASIRLDDGRHVRIVGLRIEPGALVLTCVTERR